MWPTVYRCPLRRRVLPETTSWVAGYPFVVRTPQFSHCLLNVGQS